MKPRHDKPAEGKPWAWAFLMSDEVPAEYHAALRIVRSIKCEKLFVASQRSQDGPAVKWLLDLRNGSTEARPIRQRVG
eukprot:844701-Pyramimonas_sp.AAC.1